MPPQEVIQVVQVDQLAVKVNLEDLAQDMVLEPFKLDSLSRSLDWTQAQPTIKIKISILVNKVSKFVINILKLIPFQILYKTFNRDSLEWVPHQLQTT